MCHGFKSRKLRRLQPYDPTMAEQTWPSIEEFATLSETVNNCKWCQIVEISRLHSSIFPHDSATSFNLIRLSSLDPPYLVRMIKQKWSNMKKLLEHRFTTSFPVPLAKPSHTSCRNWKRKRKMLPPNLDTRAEAKTLNSIDWTAKRMEKVSFSFPDVFRVGPDLRHQQFSSSIRPFVQVVERSLPQVRLRTSRA